MLTILRELFAVVPASEIKLTRAQRLSMLGTLILSCLFSFGAGFTIAHILGVCR